MKTNLKALVFPVFIFVVFFANAQNKESFSISFSYYNHAESIFAHRSYILNNDSLVIKIMSPKTEKIIFSKSIDRKVIDEIRDLVLDTLQEYYFNNCVMITSGNEYIISLREDGITSKNIRLHHYYLKQIEQLITIINDQSPEKNKIHYLTAKTKQDCE